MTNSLDIYAHLAVLVLNLETRVPVMEMKFVKRTLEISGHKRMKNKGRTYRNLRVKWRGYLS